MTIVCLVHKVSVDPKYTQQSEMELLETKTQTTGNIIITPEHISRYGNVFINETPFVVAYLTKVTNGNFCPIPRLSLYLPKRSY